MKEVQIRYRHEEDLSAVPMTTIGGETIAAIGEDAVRFVSELNSGVYHIDPGYLFDTHSWQAVFDGRDFYVEVVAHEDDDA